MIHQFVNQGLFPKYTYDEMRLSFSLGAGFNNCIEDYQQYKPEEFLGLGVNDSMIHVDFMIGTKDLDIDGITPDGKRIAIFRQGNWAI